MSVLVIGGSGLVGSNVIDLAQTRKKDVHATYYSTKTNHTGIELDKTNADHASAVIEDIDPEVIIDTAAFHAVDECETERQKAWSVNATGTRNVAVAANAINAHLIYLSTDYIFPGDPHEAPYEETDPVKPVNYYAETKYAGEQAAEIANSATILRSSVIYGRSADNFVTWALGELKAGNEIGIVKDQTSAPTYAPDLAQACLDVAEQGITGLYHATGPKSVSRYEFVRTLADVYDCDIDLIDPITTQELGQTALRPEDSTLESTRLYDVINSEFLPPVEGFRLMRDRQ